MRLELGLEDFAQAENHVCILARVVASRFDGAFVERDCRASLPTKIRVRCHRMVEKLETQHIEPMRAATGIEDIARQHRVEVQSGELNAQAAKQQQVELRVVASLADRRVLEHIPKQFHFRRVERRKIANGHWAPFAQHSRGDT